MLLLIGATLVLRSASPQARQRIVSAAPAPATQDAVRLGLTDAKPVKSSPLP